MIDEQLREAVRQLDTASQRLTIPVPRQRRSAGPLQAVASAIVVVVAIGAGLAECPTLPAPDLLGHRRP